MAVSPTAQAGLVRCGPAAPANINYKETVHCSHCTMEATIGGASSRKGSIVVDETNCDEAAGAQPSLAETTALRRMEEADRLSFHGDYEGAIAILSRCIFLVPRNAQLYAKRGKCFLDLGDMKSALINYIKAIDLDSELSHIKEMIPPLYDAEGMLYFDTKEYSLAVESFTEAITLDPLVPTFYAHRAACRVHLNAFDKALKDIDHAIYLDDRNADYYIFRGKVYQHLGMTDNSAQQMEVASILAPDHPEVKEYHASCGAQATHIFQNASEALLKGDPATAIKLLTKVLALAPEDLKALLLRAAAYRQHDCLPESLMDIEAASSIFAETQRQLLDAAGAATGNDSDDDNASDTAQPDEDDSDDAAARDHPEITRQRNLTLNAVALHHFAKGKYSRTVTVLNKVIRAERELRAALQEPMDARLFLNRGDAYRALHKIELALSDYHSAEELEPLNPSIQQRIALIHDMYGVQAFNEGAVASAEEEFTRAIALAPGIPDFYIHRAKAHLLQQRHSSAFQDLLKVLRKDSRHGEALQLLTPLVPPNTDIASLLQQHSPRYPAGAARQLPQLRPLHGTSAALLLGTSKPLPSAHSGKPLLLSRSSERKAGASMLRYSGSAPSLTAVDPPQPSATAAHVLSRLSSATHSAMFSRSDDVSPFPVSAGPSVQQLRIPQYGAYKTRAGPFSGRTSELPMSLSPLPSAPALPSSIPADRRRARTMSESTSDSALAPQPQQPQRRRRSHRKGHKRGKHRSAGVTVWVPARKQRRATEPA